MERKDAKRGIKVQCRCITGNIYIGMILNFVSFNSEVVIVMLEDGTYRFFRLEQL